MADGTAFQTGVSKQERSDKTRDSQTWSTSDLQLADIQRISDLTQQRLSGLPQRRALNLCLTPNAVYPDSLERMPPLAIQPNGVDSSGGDNLLANLSSLCQNLGAQSPSRRNVEESSSVGEMKKKRRIADCNLSNFNTHSLLVNRYGEVDTNHGNLTGINLFPNLDCDLAIENNFSCQSPSALHSFSTGVFDRSQGLVDIGIVERFSSLSNSFGNLSSFSGINFAPFASNMTLNQNQASTATVGETSQGASNSESCNPQSDNLDSFPTLSGVNSVRDPIEPLNKKLRQESRSSRKEFDGTSPRKLSTGSDLKTTEGANSLEVFMSFVKEIPDPKNPKKLIIDASGVLSRECYDAWIETRRNKLKRPEESFRRALTAHLTGADRRRPFNCLAEKSLLEEVRKQEIWPCFDGRKSSEGKEIRIGEQGFRTMGFNEKKKYEAMQGEINKPKMGHQHTVNQPNSQTGRLNATRNWEQEHKAQTSAHYNSMLKQFSADGSQTNALPRLSGLSDGLRKPNEGQDLANNVIIAGRLSPLASVVPSLLTRDSLEIVNRHLSL